MHKKIVSCISMVSIILALVACKDSSTSTPVIATTETKNVAKADTTTNQVNSGEGMLDKMSIMMDKMKNTRLSGDFDLDFIALMTEHHQGAVDISEIALSKVTDPQIRAMSQTMVEDHKSEIAQLEQFRNHHDTSSTEHKKAHIAGHNHAGKEHDELPGDLTSMMDKMKGVTMTGNADKDYVMLMQAHHESAIKLSEEELTHGHHADLKKMAKKMIADDKREIEEFKKWKSSVN